MQAATERLSPTAVVGNIAGLWIARRLPARAFRNAVVVLVILAGALTVVGRVAEA